MLVGITTPQYWPSRGPSALYFHALAHGLTGKGNEVLLFCAGEKDAADYEMKGLTVVRCGSDLGAGLSRWQRLMRLMYYHLRAFFFILTSNASVSVWVIDGPLYWNVGAILAVLLKRLPFIYLVHDIYPDVLIHAGILKKGSFIARLIEWAECFPMRKALRVLTLSDGMTSVLAARLPKKIHVSTLPFPVHPIFFKNENTALSSPLLPDPPVLLYAGGLGIAHNLGPFLSWARKAKTCGGGVRFKLVSDFQRSDLWRNENAVEKLLPVPWEQLHALYSECTAGYVGLPRGWGDGSLPSKTFSILASGRPVVAVADGESELSRMIADHGLGIVFDLEEAETELAYMKVMEFLTDAAALAECSKRAVQFAIDSRSPEVIAEQLVGFLNE